MDCTTFCETCKRLRKEGENYCVECGMLLRPIGNEILPLNEVCADNICQFLKDVLGYKEVLARMKTG